jgi:hypothetical protein
MNKKDKELIIDLLFDKYKETRDPKILDLMKKVGELNFTANHLIMRNTNIITDETMNFDDLSYEELDLSDMCVEIKNKKIRVTKIENINKMRVNICK